MLQLKVKNLTDEQKKLFRDTALDLNETNKETASVATNARKEWAAQFGDFLMKTIPPAGTIRDIFEVREVNGPEAKFLIDLNDIVAWEAPTFGHFSRNVIEGDEVYVRWTAFATTCYYPLTYAQNADYSVASYALQKMTEALVREEEKHGWYLIRAAANNGDDEQKITIADGLAGCGSFSKELLNAAALYFESEGKKIDTIYMPPECMGDIRMWTTPDIDPTTQRQYFVNAGTNSIWNIEIKTVPLIVFYKSVEDRKARRKTVIDRLFDQNDKTLDGAAVWSAAAKSLYAEGNMKVCYGISKTNFGILATRGSVKTFEDPIAIREWMQGIIARYEVGFVIVDGTNIVRLVIDYTSTEPA